MPEIIDLPTAELCKALIMNRFLCKKFNNYMIHATLPFAGREVNFMLFFISKIEIA